MTLDFELYTFQRFAGRLVVFLNNKCPVRLVRKGDHYSFSCFCSYGFWCGIEDITGDGFYLIYHQRRAGFNTINQDR